MINIIFIGFVKSNSNPAPASAEISKKVKEITLNTMTEKKAETNNKLKKIKLNNKVNVKLNNDLKKNLELKRLKDENTSNLLKNKLSFTLLDFNHDKK